MEQTLERVWKPSQKQEKFLSLPDKVFEGLYGGAAGGGKSEVLGLLPLVRKFTDHPRFKALLLRRTYPELEKELIPRMQDYYKAAGASYNDTKKCFTFPSGAKVFFGHIENELDVKKYDTAEFNYIAFDELTSFTKYQYVYLISTRCRTSSPDLPTFVRSGTNPGNVGHAWVKEHFKIDEVPNLTIIKDKVTGNLKVFVQAFLSDNPYIDPDYTNKLELLRTVNETDYKAKKFGDWNCFEGQVFIEWRDFHHDGEADNALHVRDVELKDWYPRILVIDWGFTAMTYACWAAILPTKQVHMYREYARKQTPISEWSSDLARTSQGENIKSIIICASAKQKRGEEKNIFEQVYDAFGDLGHLLKTADNDRIGGKNLLQEFLRWRERPKKWCITEQYNQYHAQELMKWKGMEAYEEYLNTFREDNPTEEILPRLLVSPSCKVFIKTIPNCIYDTNNKEDVKEFDGDDPYDVGRYLCKEVDRYCKDTQKEQERIETRAKVIERAEQVQDMNYLYRSLEKLEAKERLYNRPIRRFHRVGLS